MAPRQGSGQAVTGSCHCGRVTIAVPAAPEWVARCNCSICRRLGSLVAYYPDDGSVRVEFTTSGATAQDPGLIDRVTRSYNARMGR